MKLVHYLPILTTLCSVVFGYQLWVHWRNKRIAYLGWWWAGVVAYGAGTLVESLYAFVGWTEFIFRAWYITGALLGGVLLAQGTVYLLLPRKTSHLLSIGLVGFLLFATAAVLWVPLHVPDGAATRLSGKGVITEDWVRMLPVFINSYAFLFLVGGAAWSAWKYARVEEAKARYLGNLLIAVGALLPGIGGSIARYGGPEALFVTELLGLLLMWRGYWVMRGDRSRSIHKIQQETSVA